jgi:hypothetical protein
MFLSSYSSAAYVKTTTDPTLIGIGARPTGTGKAFVGLADDVNAIFMNPAGLAGQKTWQVQSMTTRLLNVIDYISFAGTYNTDYGTFGLGYVGASLSGSFVTTMELSDGEGGIIFPVAEEESINYSSTVMLLSYGSDSQRFLNNNYMNWMNFDFMKKVDFGATLKIFSQGLSGGGITDGLSTGYDMDLGMLYKPLPYLSFGWNQIDALPVSMGGKITSGGGNEQALPTTSKLGMALKVLGDDSLYGYTQPLIYLLDFDYMPLRTEYPTLVRTGVEWWPSNYLALRFGLDQDVIGADESSGFDIETNWTTGIGVQASGFKFDYAYHKYGIVTENDTSYLSISYLAPIEFAAPPPPPTPTPAPKEKGYLKIIPSQDKLITYDEGTSIKGKVLNVKEATKLTINGNEVAFAQDGSFDSTWPLAIGKNTFEVKVFGANDQLLESTKVRLLRLTQFKDVQEGYWAKEPIELLATLGIIGGYQNGTFQPDRLINRAELTALLVRAKNPGTPEAVDTSFSDVPRKHWASYFIKLGADSGLVTGYKNGTFQPAKSLNRAEGVTILSRFAELKLPEELTEGPFPDVPGRHWAAKAVTAARSAGMLVFLTDKPFEPNKELTRAEAADILSKTAFAVQKINNLKDFDTY